MKDPFETWYDESGYRFDHLGKSRNAMEIAFCRGEVVGMERAMGYRKGEQNENKDCDMDGDIADSRGMRRHQEQHMAD